MNLELDPNGICRKPIRFWQILDSVGHSIICHSGSLRATQCRDELDVALGAGQSFALDRDGLASVQVLELNAISIAPAPKGSVWPLASLLPHALARGGLAQDLAAV